MSRRNWLFALTATAALTPLALLAAPAAGPSAPPGAVERGRYLVMLAGCNRCHTPWEASGLGPRASRSHGRIALQRRSPCNAEAGGLRPEVRGPFSAAC